MPEELTVVFRPQEYHAAHASVLLAMAEAAAGELPGHPDLVPPLGDELTPAGRGLFVVAYVNGEPRGSGGYRTYPGDPGGDTVELVRMYVRPGTRRAGLGRALLAELEALAVDEGYLRAVIEAGEGQRGAQVLYRLTGYHPLPGDRGAPGRVRYGKELADRTD
ncbi:MAG TPA: GNAT family N-acetyltransferase [Pseudonocardia sp.]|jgi:GNAT superfamily N-acetyltransferase